MKRTAPPPGYAAAVAAMQTNAVAALMHQAVLAGKGVPSVPMTGVDANVIAAAHQRLMAALPGRKIVQH